MVFALAGDSTMTSGLPPDAAVRLRGARSPVLDGDFVVLVGGTVLLSRVLVQAPGRTRSHTGQREPNPFGHATVGHCSDERPCGEQIWARRALWNDRGPRLFPGPGRRSSRAHPSVRTPATTCPIAARVGRSAS